jgi:uncharacterized coiled-coil protein SlyX
MSTLEIALYGIFTGTFLLGFIYWLVKTVHLSAQCRQLETRVKSQHDAICELSKALIRIGEGQAIMTSDLTALVVLTETLTTMTIRTADELKLIERIPAETIEESAHGVFSGLLED